MEPVAAAGDQVSGAALPPVQRQLPYGATAVPRSLDRDSGLVRNDSMLELDIFMMSLLIL